MPSSSSEQHQFVAPRDLTLHTRFDIAIKYAYAAARVSGALSPSHERAYVEHIRRLNSFTEVTDGGVPTKLGRKEFVSAFDTLIDDIATHGFNSDFPVPVTDARVPTNGAHRVAAALAIGVDVPIVMDRKASSFAGYTFDYFVERHLPEDCLDMGARAFLSILSELHVVVIFGAAIQHARMITTELSSRAHVLASRKIALKQRGQGNLIRVFYDGERWLGKRQFGYLGARGKSRPCFPPTAPSEACVLLVQRTGAREEMVDIKNAIRERIGLGKHALHITDSAAEVVRVVPWLFDGNGRHLLNHRRYGHFPAFEREIALLRERLGRSKVPADRVCVVGSACLSLYGLRDCRDLDVICATSDERLIEGAGVDVSNEHWRKYGFDVDALVRDPANHLQCDGLKFVTLDNLAQLKKRRGEAKDRVDLALISSTEDRFRGAREELVRAKALVRLYSNPRWLRSFAGHWLYRLGVRARRKVQ